jgi:hypothetical protein
MCTSIKRVAVLALKATKRAGMALDLRDIGAGIPGRSSRRFARAGNPKADGHEGPDGVNCGHLDPRAPQPSGERNWDYACAERMLGAQKRTWTNGSELRRRIVCYPLRI